MLDLIIVLLVVCAGFMSLWVRYRGDTLRTLGVSIVLCIATTAIGQLPSLILLGALPAVMWQHEWHPVICAASTFPPFVIIAGQLLPRDNNVVWTFLTLCVAVHAALGANWSEDTLQALRKKGVFAAVCATIILSLVGGFVALTLGGVAIALVAWYQRVPLGLRALHGVFHSIGARFA